MITYENSIINIGTSGPYISTGDPLNGMVRYAYGRMEVYDGSTWTTIGESEYVLSNEVLDVLNWANEKMENEVKLDELAKKYPAVRDMLVQILEKQEQLDMLVKLVESNTNEVKV